jgi:hypothetical protein
MQACLREGEREGGREGGREGEGQGGREGGRRGEREGGREGVTYMCTCILSGEWHISSRCMAIVKVQQRADKEEGGGEKQEEEEEEEKEEESFSEQIAMNEVDAGRDSATQASLRHRSKRDLL